MRRNEAIDLISKLEYRLARKVGEQLHGAGQRYDTKEAARKDAPLRNSERAARGLGPLNSIMTIVNGERATDGSRRLVKVDPL